MTTLLLRAASYAAWIAVNGGATTTSTPVVSFTRRRSSLTYFTVSSTVLYIFQLPAISGVRIDAPGPAKAGHYVLRRPVELPRQAGCVRRGTRATRRRQWKYASPCRRRRLS